MLVHPISWRDPLASFEIFSRDPHAALLDSAAMHDGKGRFSYMAFDPFCTIEAARGHTTVNGAASGLDPFTALERELGKYRAEIFDAPVPFAGGAIGYLGYGLGAHLERLPRERPDVLDLPSLVVGLYDVVIAFDHAEHKAWILSSGWPEQTPALREKRARERTEYFARKLDAAPAQFSPVDWQPRGSWQAEMERSEVERRITTIVDYIHAGDIFQANFTQRFHAVRPRGLDDFMLYRRLREINPAPFASFLRCGEKLSIAGASPERFLQLKCCGTVEAQPIKGTRPRDSDPVRDAALARELQDSAKDRAENLMIVDLMRNDLSRACVPGSVAAPHLCALESFASVHHLTSTVTGKLKPGAGPVDLLRASFPGGSVTGAPKIRAMEIIHELEPAPRGVYCGCLGWIGFDQAMDMSMTIRTLTIAGDTILAQAGGGIVADSDPAAEYEESMTKIAPLLRAVTAEGK